jgi:hypothetical protein
MNLLKYVDLLQATLRCYLAPSSRAALRFDMILLDEVETVT